MSKPTLVIPVAILVGGAIVALSIYLTIHTPEASTGSGTGDPSFVTPVTPSDNIFGNPSAPIKIVEYADFDCEYCAQFDTTMQEIMTNYGASGEIAWVYRNFPITSLHPNAMSAAEAAECVAKTAGSDAYWKFADSLFTNQPVDPTNYLSYAQAAGADPNAVGTCEESASSTVDTTIDAQVANAKAIGALGTPYSVMLVPGQTPVVIDGAYPYSAMQQLVQQALSEIATSTSGS